MSYRQVIFYHEVTDPNTERGGVAVESGRNVLFVDFEQACLLLPRYEAHLRAALDAGRSYDTMVNTESFWLWVRKIADAKLEELWRNDQQALSESRVAARPL